MVKGEGVDLEGVAFGENVFIENRSGESVHLAEMGGELFPRTSDGRPLIEDTRILIVEKEDAGTSGTSSPIQKGGFARSLVFAVTLGVLTCVSGCGPDPGTPPTTPPPVTKEFDTNLAIAWQDTQINATTNLIRSFQDLPPGDPSFNVTWIYNQAQGIEGFLAGGQISKAKQLADGLLALQRAHRNLS